MSETVAILNAYARNLEAERDALRARVAQLEAALKEARKLGMKIYHNANAHEATTDWATVKAMMDEAIKDTPQ